MSALAHTIAACDASVQAIPRSTMIERAASDFRTAWIRRERSGLSVAIAFPPLEAWEARIAIRAAWTFAHMENAGHSMALYEAEKAAILMASTLSDAPPITLSQHALTARKEMGEVEWQRLNREWGA